MNFSDADFHIAGDGRLGGIVEPNPAKCYNDSNEYQLYDYPSISQINYVAKQNNINIIFAIVTRKNSLYSGVYEKLSKAIEHSNFGILDKRDTKNVINLVVENYKVFC